jgi:hypothetical protein
VSGRGAVPHAVPDVVPDESAAPRAASPFSLPPPSRAWGALALAFYAIHAGHHLLRGHPEDLLWACHLGAVCVGVGLLARLPAVNAVGFLWLATGDALWLLDLASGGEFIPTSLFTHGGGLALGALGLARFGMPRHSWWRAMLAFLVLQQLCRFTAPPQANVNLAHAVWSGWEEVFPSTIGYQIMLLAIGAAACFAVERISRRVLDRFAARSIEVTSV